MSAEDRGVRDHIAGGQDPNPRYFVIHVSGQRLPHALVRVTGSVEEAFRHDVLHWEQSALLSRMADEPQWAVREVEVARANGYLLEMLDDARTKRFQGAYHLVFGANRDVHDLDKAYMLIQGEDQKYAGRGKWVYSDKMYRFSTGRDWEEGYVAVSAAEAEQFKLRFDKKFAKDDQHTLRANKFADLLATLLSRSPSHADVRRDVRINDDLVIDLLDASVHRLVHVMAVTPYTGQRMAEAIDHLTRCGAAYEAASGTHPILAIAFPDECTLTQAKMFPTSTMISVFDKRHVSHSARHQGVLAQAEELLGAYTVDDAVKHSASVLLENLRKVQPGRKHASAYRTACGVIMDNLFKSSWDPLAGPYRNATTGDWQTVTLETSGSYWADELVLHTTNDFGKLWRNDVLRFANSMPRDSTGILGVIVTRLGAGRAAREACRDQWVTHRKMILVLSDEDIAYLLEIMGSGGAPVALIQQKIEDFLQELENLHITDP